MSVFLLDYGRPLSKEDIEDQLRGHAGTDVLNGIMQFLRNEALGELQKSTDALVEGKLHESNIALAHVDALTQIVAKLHAGSMSEIPLDK